MPEQKTDGTTVPEETNSQGQEQKSKEFEAITSQEDFDRAIQDRIARERKKFADYDDLKVKADKLAEIEAANQTEAEKAAARAEVAEKRAAEFEIKAIRAEVAAAKNVPIDLLSGSTKDELEAAADALIQFKGTAGNRMVVGQEGKAAVPASSPSAQFAEFLTHQLGQ